MNNDINHIIIDKNSVLIDIRENKEYIQGHIQGSINIPIDDFCISKYKDFENFSNIYIYCRSGNRTRRLCYCMDDKNLNIIDLGGINSYKGKLVK